MHTPYHSPEQFREKAALLAGELSLDAQGAQEALAHLSGYEDPSAIGESASDAELLWSREELTARLLAMYPDIAHDRAAAMIDKLDLPMRETDMARLACSPGAAPNMGG